MAAASREALLALIEKYRRPKPWRGFEMAWTRAQLEFRYLGIGPAAAHRFQELAEPSALSRTHGCGRSGDRLARNRLGQSALWAYGISGDLPMLAVTVADARSLPLVRELLLAHTYWRLRGFHADLIILNQEAASYDQPLHQQLLRQIEAHSHETGHRQARRRVSAGLARDSRGPSQPVLRLARVVLSGSRGSLQQQLAARERAGAAAAVRRRQRGQEEPSRPLPFLELPYFNGLGGFTPDGREYAIYLSPAATRRRRGST